MVIMIIQKKKRCNEISKIVATKSKNESDSDDELEIVKSSSLNTDIDSTNFVLVLISL